MAKYGNILHCEYSFHIVKLQHFISLVSKETVLPGMHT